MKNRSKRHKLINTFYKSLTGDLAGQLRLSLVDEGVEALSDHVLLLLGGRRSEGSRRKRLVRGRGSLKRKRRA